MIDIVSRSRCFALTALSIIRYVHEMFNTNLRCSSDAPTPRRCGAKLRQGGTCPLPPAAGKNRCFQHGGARGIGPPKGSRNARKHGFFSREAIAERRHINGFIRRCLQTLRDVDEMMKK